MNQKQIFTFILLLSVSVFSINCRPDSIIGSANQGSSVEPSKPSVKSSKLLAPLERHPNPVKFADLDLRDAVREFKQKFGADFELTQMTVEPNAVTISLYANQNFSGEWRYENGGISKLMVNNQFDEKPNFEKSAYNSSNQTSEQKVKTPGVAGRFQINEIPLLRIPEVARIAQKQIWIEGGEVKKIKIFLSPSNWSATVAGKQSEIIHHFKVTEDSAAILDQDNFERRPNINALDAEEMQQRIERINEDFGGKLKMLNIMFNEYAVSFVAQDPQKPEEFNSYYYSLDGEKRKPSAVADADVRRYVEDAKEKNSKVRSIDDLLFTPADLNSGSLPQIAEKSLNELRLEKSRISNISVRRGEYFKFDGGDLKCEINVDGDNRRRSGFARYGVNGELLKTDKR